MQDPATVLWYLIAIFAVGAVLYASNRIITRRLKVDLGYGLRIFLIAVIIVFIIPIFQTIVAPFISQLAIVIAYTIIILSVRFILDSSGEKTSWPNSIAISFICVVLIFVINIISEALFGITIIAL
ncbi:MAG: hypothetical protein ACTSSJ_03485 [Candidatus Odinarchaeia archaeon]